MVAIRLLTDVQHLLKKDKVTLVEAEEKIGGLANGLRAIRRSTGNSMMAQHLIIATGARARAPEVKEGELM